ncbi:recombinase family protein [Streptomyces canus]|uniref:recombinase family protein n=1 Tax=Streptomyces canus TaxID=58343 RepID=UPI003696E574
MDALAKHGIGRDKIFSEKISTRIKVRPQFEEALKTAREIKAHAPHCRVIFTVFEMKRLGRDAAELTALADHLTEHGLVLEMLAGPLPGIYDPTGPGKLLFGFFAAMAETPTPTPPPPWQPASATPSGGPPRLTPQRSRCAFSFRTEPTPQPQDTSSDGQLAEV